MRLLRPLVVVLFAIGVVPQASGAGPTIDIVTGAEAPALERLAATDLAAQFKRLFGAEAKIADRAPANSERLVLVGSPATNPAIGKALGKDWPELSDQGHLLKSATWQGRQALIVGGGSPVATLWAAYELGQRFGIRYLLSGDVYPAKTPECKLDGFDVVLEPTLRLRTWRTINDFAIGPESWGLEEHRRVLRQLAKLKFNRVLLSVYPWQPFVHYEFRGVKKSTAMLWYGYRYPVGGDTAGRVAFRGQEEFYNPDLAGNPDYESLSAAGVGLARGVIDAARELGMSSAICMSPLEFPKEFAQALPGAKTVYQLESLTIGPGPQQPPDDPLLLELVKAQIRAYLETYPQLDALYLTLPEFPDWVEHYESSWKRLDKDGRLSQVASLEELTAAARDRHLVASGERGVKALQGNIAALDFFQTLLADESLFHRANGQRVETVVIQPDPALFSVLDKVLPAETGALHLIDYTARRAAENRELLARVPAAKVNSSLILTLADDNVGVLPQMATHQIHTLVGDLRTLGWQGFSTRYWLIGDLDPAVYYLSRAACDPQVTPESAYEDLITAMCGEGVSERLTKAFDMIEQATMLIDKNDLGFTFPVPGVVMKHYTAEGPPPAWWQEASDLYLNAMNEVYRGHDRSHVNGRPLLRHFAKRCEFALEYLGAIQALRLAGQAKAKGDAEEQGVQLEKAVEGMYNGLNALAEVAVDNSDRGVIAVLNEYGYRPLVKEMEAVQAAVQ